VAVLTGFMAGSLLKIWPFKVVLETRINSHGEVVPVVERPVWPDLSQDSGVLLGALGLAAIGLAIILILDRWNPEKHEN